MGMKAVFLIGLAVLSVGAAYAGSISATALATSRPLRN